MVVHPAELVEIQLRRRHRQVRAVEPLHQLLAREDLVVAVAPAQPRQIVDDGIRQVAILLVLQHRHRTMPLGKLLAVRPVDHRQMPVDGGLGTQRAQDVDLPRRVVDVVVTADHVGDAHVQVIDHHAEVVGGRAVRSGNHQVVQLGIADGDAPLDHVIPHHHAVVRIAETHHRLHVRRRLLAGRILGPPAAVIARLLAPGPLRLAHGLQLFGRGIAVVGTAISQHLVQQLAIAVHPLHLVERPLVGVQPQPVQPFQNGGHRLGRGTLHVRVFNAQHIVAAMMPGKGPGVERRAHAPDMQKTRGAGGKAGAHPAWHAGRGGRCGSSSG